MYTYQMVGIADDNGRTYESKYGTYNKEDGFIWSDPPNTKGGWTELIYELLHEDVWKLKQEPVKEMTLQEIVKDLGYRVIIRDPEPEKKEVSEDKKKEVDDTIDFLRRFLGLDNINPEDYY